MFSLIIIKWVYKVLPEEDMNELLKNEEVDPKVKKKKKYLGRINYRVRINKI